MTEHLESVEPLTPGEDFADSTPGSAWRWHMSGLARRGGELLRRVPPLRVAVRSAREIHRQLRPQIWELEGRERASGERLNVLFHGLLENRNYLRDLIYEGLCRETTRGVWSWELDDRLRDAGSRHALAIAECTALPACLPPNTFYIPCWIGGEFELAEAAERRHASADVKRSLLRIRKNRFDYTVSRAPADILRFYDEMYRPYVSAVYGDCAFLEPRANLEAKLDRTELLLIHQDGRPLAGEITRFEADKAYSWLLGVIDGDRRHVRNGVHAAIYHFSLVRLAELGYSRVDVGESRPFLRDGVLRYKAKWGLRLQVGTPKWFALTLIRPSAGARAFLMNNPFIYQAREGLYGAFFCEARSPRPSPGDLDALKIKGVAGMSVFRAASGSGWNAAGFRPWGT